MAADAMQCTVGRGAPEIDIFEAQIGTQVGTSGEDTTALVGTVSQSAQWAVRYFSISITLTILIFGDEPAVQRGLPLAKRSGKI